MALEIALTILKVIGITLGCILGLLLVIVLIALFVPFRYSLGGAYAQEGSIDASAKVTFLLHMISVYVDFNKPPAENAGLPDKSEKHIKSTEPGLRGGVKLFGIMIFNFFPTEEEKEKRRLKKQKKEEKAQKRKQNKEARKKKEEDIQESVQETVNTGQDNTDTEQNTGAQHESFFSQMEPDSETGDDVFGEDEDFDPGLIEKIRLVILKLYDLFCFLNEKLLKLQSAAADMPDAYEDKKQSLVKKAHDLKKKAKAYYCISQKEYTKNAFHKAKKAIFKILKAIAPRKGYLKAELGMEDVAVTGQIAGIYGMLIGMFYPFIGRHVTAEFDFDDKALSAELSLRGRIMLCSFIRAVWLYFFDRDVRHLKAVLKKAGNM